MTTTVSGTFEPVLSRTPKGLLNGRAPLPVCVSPAPSRALQDCAGNMPRIWGELSRLPDGENRASLARAVGLSHGPAANGRGWTSPAQVIAQRASTGNSALQRFCI